MTTAAEWWQGARPRTLPAAVAPVAAGSGVAAFENSFIGVHAMLSLVVALALQVGVNYANDYSDGVRGTDDARVGPMRLVASGRAAPATVRTAALATFGVATAAGLVLVGLTDRWQLLLVGAAAVLAGWYYTGGGAPYGYRGLGELSVFVFFGLVAVVGTAYVQTDQVTALAVVAAVPVGLLATALLIANNLRDIPSDYTAGKVTLAVRMGARRTRALYVLLVVTAVLLGVVVAATWTQWALLTLAACVPALRPARAVARGATGPALLPVLRDTGHTLLTFGVLLGLGLALGAVR